MANELTIQLDPATQSGLTVVARLYAGTVQVGIDIACSELPATSGRYVASVPGGTAVGDYGFGFYSGGGGTTLLGTGELGWTGTAERQYLPAWAYRHDGSQIPVDGGGGASGPGTTIVLAGSYIPLTVPIQGDIEILVGATLDVTFVAEGFDLTGWASVAFTVKRSRPNDADGESLIVAEVESGGGGGLRILNGQVAAMPANGVMSVVQVAPEDDANVRVLLKPAATLIEPSEGTAPFAYEVSVYYADGHRRVMARGDATATMPSRRATTAP